MAKQDAGITLDAVEDLKTRLSEARRTYAHAATGIESRFVEPKSGLVSQLMSRSHHLIQGRRGTGKSTVIQVLNHRAKTESIPVAMVDMEKHKNRQYPDVLIEVLVEMLEKLRPAPSSQWKQWENLALRIRVKRVVKRLSDLLGEPDVMTTQVSRSRKRNGEIGLGAGLSHNGVRAKADAGASSLTNTNVSGGSDARKIDRLRDLAPTISKLLSDLVARTPGQRSLVFVDDYYFIATDEQPLVIDYLHSVCKGTGAWLKVGGVGSRLKLYREGDPPIGVQIPEDMSRLPLDVTLEDFKTGKRFLEDVLNGIVAPQGLSVRNIMNDGARDRIVLACGGAVPRDYINLVLDSLDFAIEKHDQDKAETFKIQTEDINRAARKRTTEKEEDDLAKDAGSDAPTLRTRWQDLQEFAGSAGQTNFLLFEQGHLTDTEWGKEIQQLENLRLLHRIGTGVPNTGTWRQVRVVIMMLDLAVIVNKRLSNNITEFWRGQKEFDKLRRAQWVYTPDWRERGKSAKAEKQTDPVTSNDDPSLF